MDHLHPPIPYIIDTTLRDGEQKPGLVFNRPDKLAIARALSDAGIAEIEAGIPAMGQEVIETIQSLTRLSLPARLSVWCRGRPEDICQAAYCQTPAIHISLPLSPRLLKALGKSTAWLYDTLHDCVRQARHYFDYISIGAQDVSRCNAQEALNFADAVYECKVQRLRLADTVGIMNPFQVVELFTHLHNRYDGLELGFHGHNDLGMATANALAAIQAGAACVDCTILGLGERAGNTPLEELVMAALISEHIDLQINTCVLRPLAVLTAQAAGHLIPASKPIVGSGLFDHESGIHIRALLADGESYEPFSSQLVGGEQRRFLIGLHSGTSAIGHILNRYGIILPESQARALLAGIRRYASSGKTALDEGELIELYYQQNRSFGIQP